MKNKKLLGILGITALLLAGNFAWREAKEVDAAAPETLYLSPSANWKQSNARFAAYFFGNGEKWQSMDDSNSDGIYEVAVPAGFTKVIFCRMNPGASANNWDSRWNQTSDLTIPTNGNNHYTVKEGTWDKGGGTWSVYTPEAEPTPVHEELATIFTSYYNDGVYLKETVINLNEEARNVITANKGFHADVDDLVRVTQFNKDTLTMTIPGNDKYESNYGTDANGNMTHWGKGGTPSLSVKKPTSEETKGSWTTLEDDGMEGYYWTLKDLIDTENYGWQKEGNKFYTTNESVIEKFKAIVAPCYVGFKNGTKNYIALEKAEVEEDNGTLQLRLYASGGDLSKFTNDKCIFAQATISQEHTHHVSGLKLDNRYSYQCAFCGETGYSLAGSFNNWTANDVLFVPNNENEVKLTYELTEGDTFKVVQNNGLSDYQEWWHGYDTVKPESVANFEGLDGGDIKVNKTGKYDFYWDITNYKLYIGESAE